MISARSLMILTVLASCRSNVHLRCNMPLSLYLRVLVQASRLQETAPAHSRDITRHHSVSSSTATPWNHAYTQAHVQITTSQTNAPTLVPSGSCVSQPENTPGARPTRLHIATPANRRIAPATGERRHVPYSLFPVPSLLPVANSPRHAPQQLT